MKILVVLSLLFASKGLCQQHADEKIECGKRYLPEETIPNRAPAEFEYQPWQVALIWRPFYFFGPEYFRCGGVLINENYILSAAHCFEGSSAYFVIAKLGIHDLNESLDRYPHEVHRIRRIIIHEHFETKSKTSIPGINDIALLELAESVIFTPLIVPICLPAYEEDFSGYRASFSGWGPKMSGQWPSSSLRRMDVLIVGNDVCAPPHIPPLSAFCGVGLDGNKACPGDSGSPLILEEDGRATLIGVASMASRPKSCFSKDAPITADIYTNVPNYMRWIDSQVNQRSDRT